ncbi:hypothetical protein PM082_009462 [Marasmius tenuissimus]|nr:hypothetical protein PM082_009462 [Marasmius tenuissimus]
MTATVTSCFLALSFVIHGFSIPSHNFSLEIVAGLPQNCAELASLLRSPHCTITLHLEELVFDLDTRNRSGEGGSDITFLYVLLIRPIVACLDNKIPSMRKLTITSRRPQQVQYSEGTTAGSPEAKLVSQFRLHIGYLDLPDGVGDGSHAVSSTSLPPSLKSLQISGRDDNPTLTGLPQFYRWLNTQNSLGLVWFSIFRISVGEDLDPDIRPYLDGCQELTFPHLGFDTWYVIYDETCE